MIKVPKPYTWKLNQDTWKSNQDINFHPASKSPEYVAVKRKASQELFWSLVKLN